MAETPPQYWLRRACQCRSGAQAAANPGAAARLYHFAHLYEQLAVEAMKIPQAERSRRGSVAHVASFAAPVPPGEPRAYSAVRAVQSRVGPFGRMLHSAVASR